MSPGTTSRPGIWMVFPSRTTLAVGADICLRLSRDASALMVWTVPRMAFMVMTARMTTILSTSPSTAEITAATMRMITRKSANCSRKIRNPDFLPPSCSSLGPYFSRRCWASLVVSPWGPLWRLSSRSLPARCQIWLGLFIPCSLPFRVPVQGHKKRDLLSPTPSMESKSLAISNRSGASLPVH